MEIVNLTEGDLEPLTELFRQFWNETSSLEKMRARFAELADNPAYYLLAVQYHGRLAGFGMGIICGELCGACRPFMVMEDLIVDHRLRRGGVGTALMQALEHTAMENDCCQIIFVTEAERTDAHRFYRSLGYDDEPYKGFKKRL